MLKIAQLQEIENYIDDRFGSWNYFGIRGFVKSALDNTLAQDYPDSPYSAKEVIEWAEWNDKDSILPTAGMQAIKGEETSDYLFGAPKVDPRTGEKNTQSKVDGIIVDGAKTAAMTGTGYIVKAVLVIGLLYIVFTSITAYSNKKLERLAL